MSQDLPERELDEVARYIRRLAQEAYDEFVRLVDAGVRPRDAIDQVAATFDQAYYERLAAAFSAILEARWTVQDIRQYRIGGVELSARLYRHWRETSAAVTAIVNEHLRGLQQARDLALELYGGYGFRAPGQEPLQVLSRLRTLPEPLRTLARNPHVRRAIVLQARRLLASTTRRTRALESAYLQAFDAAIGGAARSRLLHLLDVAVFEKSRYFANRIAQTELARAHADRVGREIMADEEVTVVEYRMSGSHPREDICDLFARVDRYGLGPGRYPKALAPRPPLHPFCRCIVRSIPGWDASDGELREGAERGFLRAMGHQAAARLLGSDHRLQQVLDGGSDALEVWNRSKKDAYKTPTLGELRD